MRVIGGERRGKKLIAPEGDNTRPTSDRTRESLFNVLLNGIWPKESEIAFHEACFLDVFAGSGAVGIEALSRGAASATFIETDVGALRCIRENVRACDMADRADIRSTDATALPKAITPFPLFFMDPPYRKDLIVPTLQALLDEDWITEGSIGVIETAKKDSIKLPDFCSVLKEKTYGIARLTFLKIQPSQPAS